MTEGECGTKEKHSFHYDSAIHSRAGSSPIRKRCIFSLRLGHARVLTPPRGVIHCARAACYPPGEAQCATRNGYLVGADSISARRKKITAALCGGIKPPSEREVDFAKQKTEGECGTKAKHSFHSNSAIHSRAGSSPIRKRLVPPPGGGRINSTRTLEPPSGREVDFAKQKTEGECGTKD